MKIYKWYHSIKAFGIGVVTEKSEHEFSFELDRFWDFGIGLCYIQIGRLYFNYTRYPHGYEPGI